MLIVAHWPPPKEIVECDSIEGSLVPTVPSDPPARLVQAMSAWSVKSRRSPSRQSRDARVYGHATTATHEMSTPFPQTVSPTNALHCKLVSSPLSACETDNSINVILNFFYKFPFGLFLVSTRFCASKRLKECVYSERKSSAPKTRPGKRPKKRDVSGTDSGDERGMPPEFQSAHFPAEALEGVPVKR